MAHQKNQKYGKDIGYDKTVVYVKLSTFLMQVVANILPSNGEIRLP
jgi:hypothetical protein